MDNLDNGIYMGEWNNPLDVIVEFHNAFSDEICDEMVDRFEKDEETKPGLSGVFGASYNGYRTKISTDLEISALDRWEDMDKRIFDTLSPYIKGYVEKLAEEFKLLELTNIQDLGYQLQRTDPGGRFDWHSDSNSEPLEDMFIRHIEGAALMCLRERIATYILYLNDRLEYELDDGTTQFKFGQNEKYIKAEKGKLILFPANILYPHRGVPLQNGVKYIMTGWVTCDIVTTTLRAPHDYELRANRYNHTAPDGFMIVEGRGSWTAVT